MTKECPKHEQVLPVAEELLGRRPDRIESFRPTVGGDDSHSFRLWAGGDRMLLKVKKRRGSPIGVRFYRRIREAGIPVPELIAFGAAAGPGGEACAVWEWIDGRPADWRPGEPCPYDEAELGEILRRIHSLRSDGPFGLLGDDTSGWVDPWHPDLGPTSDDWAGFFHCESAARRYFSRGFLTRHEADVLASLPDRLGSELNPVEPHLLHMGDVMHNGNVLVEHGSGRIAAVVDYVESTAGDPRWELAWLDYYFAENPFDRTDFDMARFRSGYGARHDRNDALGRFYLLAILVFEKLLFLDPGSPRGRWALETARSTLNSLGTE
jgi:aminoglycoside phosphotransferase (APT) family kinase protein